MAYEKQTWVTGEVITKEKLNHMEDGIANSGGILFLSEDGGGTLDKTWNEINTALRNGQLVFVLKIEEEYVDWLFVGSTGIGRNNVYNLIALGSDAESVEFTTDAPVGHPVRSGSPE